LTRIFLSSIGVCVEKFQNHQMKEKNFKKKKNQENIFFIFEIEIKI
jgi:hypothetical protein